jgi:DNA-nicking Smr family endonuclease
MRRLSPEERRLWKKVAGSVRPLEPQAPDVPDDAPAAAIPRLASKPVPPPSLPPRSAGDTLDGSWDRRLGRGLVRPDSILDLHGHGLAAAHRLLDDRLEAAIAAGARVLLLITGKPPGAERPVARGRIRAAVGDWLAVSRHAGRIAAVRNAHPRHGGAGALYIVLRRPR